MELSEALKTGIGIQLSEALGTGGTVTLVGMSIVFLVLIILMIVLMLFKVIFYKDASKKQEVKEVKEVVKQEEKIIVNEVKNAVADDEEIIAVLTAAIAASLNTSTYNLKIKSYRRVENTKPAWNRAGINETINNRF